MHRGTCVLWTFRIKTKSTTFQLGDLHPSYDGPPTPSKIPGPGPVGSFNSVHPRPGLFVSVFLGGLGISPGWEGRMWDGYGQCC